MQFVDKFFDGVVPEYHDKNSIFASIDIKNQVNEVIDLYEDLELKKALLKILDLSSIGNKFFQDNEPWSAIKTDNEKAKNIIGGLACFVKDISILLYPYIPKTIIKVFDLLNLKKDDILLKNINNKELIVNKKIKKPVILFNKLEKEQIEQFKIKFSGSQQTAEVKVGFNKLHLKAGKIIEVKRHPKADKLYIEKIELGNNETRQIVSGLVPYYKEDELLNKNIILVYNLKPTIIRGEKSEGMLLAAENENRVIVEVISPECNIGDTISIDGAETNTSEITIEEFFSVPLKVDNYEIKYEDKNLKVNNKKITVQKVKDGKVG